MTIQGRLPSPSLEPTGSPLDAAKCPRACGDYLSFRSAPLTGITQQCCRTCGTPWTAVPRRRLVEPPPARVKAPVDRSLVDTRPMRDALLQAVPIGRPRAVRAGTLCERFGRHRTATHKVLLELRRAGAVCELKQGKHVLVWRAA